MIDPFPLHRFLLPLCLPLCSKRSLDPFKFPSSKTEATLVFFKLRKLKPPTDRLLYLIVLQKFTGVFRGPPVITRLSHHRLKRCEGPRLPFVSISMRLDMLLFPVWSSIISNLHHGPYAHHTSPKYSPPLFVKKARCL
ncbi:MAG: hypothetical protein CM15mV63_170 [uncultured marine virus]|nr:MAG: hypothetical protein CM15mV63_170 [uncultured marine virus]